MAKPLGISWHLIGALLVWIAPAGCSQAIMLSAARPAATEAQPEPPTLEEDVSPDAEWDPLVTRLEKAAWTRDLDWTPRFFGVDEWTFGNGPCRPLRWRFPGLEELARSETKALNRETQPEAEAQRLVARLEHLASTETVAGRNAAIALVHWKPAAGGSVLKILETLVRRTAPAAKSPVEARAENGREAANDRAAGAKSSAPPSISLRCAAAEAWCIALAAQPGDSLEKRLSPAGRALQDERLPVEVRGELMRSLAIWIPPAAIPGLNEVFNPVDPEDLSTQRDPPEMRRAAIEACLIRAWRIRPPEEEFGPKAKKSATVPATASSDDATLWNADEWPEQIHHARNDPNSTVRKTYGSWLAVAGSPQAFKRLKTQLSDSDVRVREEALLSLGLVGSDEARREIDHYAKQPEERIRECAARGLAAFGPDALAPLATDEAVSVRLAVAEELAERPSDRAAYLLRPMLHDPDSQVQLRAANSLKSWPDRLAVPLLLQGLRSSGRRTRDAAWNDLRRRVRSSEDFPIDGADHERQAFIEQLVAEHKLAIDLPLSSVAARAPSPPTELATYQVESILETLHTQSPASPEYIRARDTALGWTERELPLIEQTIRQHGGQMIPFVEHEVLPRLNPVYGQLAALDSTDVFLRRRAAQQLAQAGNELSLPPLLIQRLWNRMSREQDQLVWRMVMSAVIQDDLPEAARLAELAVNHHWPDVRVLGCEYARRHHRPNYTAWLMPLFQDGNKNVQLAAVQAAGECRNPQALDGLPARSGSSPLPGIRSLLASSDARLRLAVVAAMSQLGDEQGMNELVRLSLSENPETREQAVRAMGQTGQTRFVDSLVQQAWTETSAPVRRALLISLEQLVPSENRPFTIGDVRTEDAKIRAWMEWWQREGRRQPTVSDVPPAERGTARATAASSGP